MLNNCIIVIRTQWNANSCNCYNEKTAKSIKEKHYDISHMSSEDAIFLIKFVIKLLYIIFRAYIKL